MKAPPFDYCRPSSMAQVFDLLRQHGESARLIAGGQTLMATLNMRLSEPKVLVDLGQVPGLRGISLQHDHVRIGAMTTHAEIEDSPLLARHMPLLSAAAPHVAHRAIRNRGTLGGSIAFADPAAEWPACALALNATLLLHGPKGQRRVLAQDFFQDLYKTALAADEVLVACEFPLATVQTRCYFDELSRRHGDYAIVGLAACGQVNDGIFSDLRLVFLGTGNTPSLARKAAALLQGGRAEPTQVTAAVAALADDLNPTPDLYNDAKTKLYLAGVLLGRALKQLARPHAPSSGGAHD